MILSACSYNLTCEPCKPTSSEPVLDRLSFVVGIYIIQSFSVLMHACFLRAARPRGLAAPPISASLVLCCRAPPPHLPRSLHWMPFSGLAIVVQRLLKACDFGNKDRRRQGLNAQTPKTKTHRERPRQTNAAGQSLSCHPA